MERPPRQDEEIRALHEEELAEDRERIDASPDEDLLEGYDDEQRAEVLEAEAIDPFGRPIMHNLMPDDGEDDRFPDEDSEIDRQQ